MSLQTLNKSRGSVLLLCLVILTLMTTVVVSTISQSTLQIRMVSNDIDREIAFNTARSELISQYNFLVSNGIKNNFFDDAVNNIASDGFAKAVDTEGYYIYKPVNLPRRGSFTYPQGQASVSSGLELIPTSIRFNHQLSEGYTTGPTETKKFKIKTISNIHENIQSTQEIHFNYRVQKGG